MKEKALKFNVEIQLFSSLILTSKILSFQHSFSSGRQLFLGGHPRQDATSSELTSKDRIVKITNKKSYLQNILTIEDMLRACLTRKSKIV